MDVNQTSYCTVFERKSQTKFICYTRRENGTFSISLTDAADVWSTDVTDDALKRLRQAFALKSAEDCITKLRSACASGAVSAVLQDTDVELHVGSGPGGSVTLSRLEGPQATAELKELLFGMADRLSLADTKCGPSVSPVKNHQRRHAEFEPRQQQHSGAPSVKKRLGGASLINPGSKKKQRATGVAFDED